MNCCISLNFLASLQSSCIPQDLKEAAIAQVTKSNDPPSFQPLREVRGKLQHCTQILHSGRLGCFAIQRDVYDLTRLGRRKKGLYISKFPLTCSASLFILFQLDSFISPSESFLPLSTSHWSYMGGSNPHTTVGPLEGGVFVANLLFGVVTSQVDIYYRKYPHDRWALKALVRDRQSMPPVVPSAEYFLFFLSGCICMVRKIIHCP